MARAGLAKRGRLGAVFLLPRPTLPLPADTVPASAGPRMMAPIIKRRIACVLLLVAVAVLAPVQAQLASSESNALIQIYIDSFSGGTSALNSLAVPWSTDTSTACNSPSWTGIGCSGGHITSLFVLR